MIRFENYLYSTYRDSIKAIYKESFSLAERFNFDILRKCNKESNVHLNCILEDDKPVGMFFTIEIPNDITYLMYFAVDSKYRGQNIGSRALQRLVTSKERVLLIIEKVKDDITERRKNFYLNNGFHSTNIFLEDTSIKYEVLISDKGYKVTEEDLLNRYEYMTKSVITKYKIRHTFDTKHIRFIQ